MSSRLAVVPPDYLPDGAKRYVTELCQLRQPDHYYKTSSAELGEFKHDDELSKRLVLDARMKPVWLFINECGVDEYFWWDFICNVQFAAREPKSINRRSPSEHREDCVELKRLFESINRISRRYGIDHSEVPVGVFFEQAKLNKIFDQPDTCFHDTILNRLTLVDYFNTFFNWFEKQSAAIKKPNHPDFQYQYFVRHMWKFFQSDLSKLNQWKILSIICSVSLGQEFSPEKVRGTCRSMVDKSG